MNRYRDSRPGLECQWEKTVFRVERVPQVQRNGKRLFPHPSLGTSPLRLGWFPYHLPLGAPIFLSTTQPNTTDPLERLMVAQDTGGAIRGGVRADFYWGSGDEAGRKAGSMKQQGKIWTLLPKDYVFPIATQEFVMKRNRIEEASK